MVRPIFVCLVLIAGTATGKFLLDEIKDSLGKESLPEKFGTQKLTCKCPDPNQKGEELHLQDPQLQFPHNRISVEDIATKLSPRIFNLKQFVRYSIRADDVTIWDASLGQAKKFCRIQSARAMDCVQLVVNVICCNPNTKIGTYGQITKGDALKRLSEAPENDNNRWMHRRCEIVLKYPGEINTLTDDITTAFHKLDFWQSFYHAPRAMCSCNDKGVFQGIILDKKDDNNRKYDAQSILGKLQESGELTAWKMNIFSKPSDSDNTASTPETLTAEEFLKKAGSCVQVMFDAVCCGGLKSGEVRTLEKAIDIWGRFKDVPASKMKEQCDHKYEVPLGRDELRKKQVEVGDMTMGQHEP